MPRQASKSSSFEDPERADRRVRRTRELLRGALVSLMEEKSYSGITVNDILERADVGRSTFYAHYHDKDELLLSGFDDIRAALKAERQAAREPDGSNRLLEPVVAAFRHVERHRHVLRQMARIDGGWPEPVVGELRDLTEALVREDLQLHFAEETSPLAIEAATQFLVGALVNLLGWWSSNDVPLDADELYAAYRTMASQGVRRYLRRS